MVCSQPEGLNQFRSVFSYRNILPSLETAWQGSNQWLNEKQKRAADQEALVVDSWVAPAVQLQVDVAL